ncbi:MAG: hypothetical protein KGL39_25375 [Patescibacteria group bacterium]|nr:hypothetical protein [Patescibacteria group bacterium]
MPNEVEDATPTESSPVEQDATAAPSTASENPVESLTTTEQEKFSDFEKVVDRAEGKEVKEEIKPEETEVETKTDEVAAEKKDETAETEGKVETEEKALSQEQEPKSFKDRPEWQRLAKLDVPEAAKKVIRGTLRELYTQQEQLVGEIEKSKPAVEIYQELHQSVGGNPQGIANIRKLMQYEKNPAEAVPMFELLLNDAKKRAGMVLQSPELLTEAQTLKKQLDEGQIDQPAFDKRNIELLELQKAKVGTERTTAELQAERDRQQRAQAEQKTQQAVTEINQAEENWSNAKSKTDPDFAAVQTLHSAFAKDNSLNFWNQNKRLPNAKEAVEILEKSLKMAKAEAAKFRPKQKPIVPVTAGGNGSSATTRQKPMTDFEKFEATVDAAVARRS